MKFIWIILITLLLVSCSNEDINEEIIYTDIDGNVYETIDIEGTLWITSDLRTISDLDGEDLTSYDVAGHDSKLYNLKMVESMILDGWRLPTPEEWDNLISKYPSVESLKESEFQLSLAGMFDFTGVYQWMNTGCLYLAKDNDGVAYYFYDGEGESLKKGSFHPKDAFSIRLVEIPE